MKMKKFLVITAVLSALMCSTEVAAQGNTLGLGTDSENTLSLAERIFKLEKKTEAISIYFNTHLSFQDRFNGDDSGASFVGRQLRFEMLGNITKHWGYRFRYRLNRPGVQQSDNFSNNIDFMMYVTSSTIVSNSLPVKRVWLSVVISMMTTLFRFWSFAIG